MALMLRGGRPGRPPILRRILLTLFLAQLLRIFIDKKRLSDYHIRTGCTVQLTLALRGGRQRRGCQRALC